MIVDIQIRRRYVKPQDLYGGSGGRSEFLAFHGFIYIHVDGSHGWRKSQRCMVVSRNNRIRIWLATQLFGDVRMNRKNLKIGIIIGSLLMIGMMAPMGAAKLSADAEATALCEPVGDGTFKATASASANASGDIMDIGGVYEASASIQAGSVARSGGDGGFWPLKMQASVEIPETTGVATVGTVVRATAQAEAHDSFNNHQSASANVRYTCKNPPPPPTGHVELCESLAMLKHGLEFKLAKSDACGVQVINRGDLALIRWIDETGEVTEVQFAA